MSNPAKPSAWIPIAWRYNTARSKWTGYDDAPLSLADAQMLAGLKDTPADPDHLFAHRITGSITELVWRYIGPKA